MTTHRFGPIFGSDGSACFRIWAPSCDHVTLEIEGRAPIPMTPGADGWFEADVPDAGGVTYTYRIRDDLAVADPASRLQSGNVHGPSVAIDTRRFRQGRKEWHGRPWHEAVIYEVHVGVVGGYDGVAAHLNRLASLGITAIELMPIATFSGDRNWGYGGVLPYAPHPAYGSPEQLCALIDAAHARGIMVLLDVVYNHFGPDGNYVAEFADAFFDNDRDSPWGRGIAFEKPEVADFFHQSALIWLFDYGFDGLRIDAAWAIPEPGWFAGLRKKVSACLEPGQLKHLVLENENNDAGLLRSGYDAQWNDDFHNTLHVLLTGETDAYYAQYAENPIAHLATILNDGFLFQGQIPPGSDKPRGQPSGDLPPSAFVVFLQNHDQIGNRAFGERLIDLTAPDALRAAYAAMLLSPFIPLLFMGEEWGCRTPFLFFTDYQDELAAAVREGRRREFDKFPAFKDSKLREHIPDPNDTETFHRAIPDLRERTTAEGRKWEELTRTLITLRRTHITPHLTQARSTGTAILSDKALSYGWSFGTYRLQIALNLGPTPIPIASPPGGDILFRTPFDQPGTVDDPGILPPFSLIVARSDTP